MAAIDTYNCTQKYILSSVEYCKIPMNNKSDKEENTLIGFKQSSGLRVLCAFCLKISKLDKNHIEAPQRLN